MWQWWFEVDACFLFLYQLTFISLWFFWNNFSTEFVFHLGNKKSKITCFNQKNYNICNFYWVVLFQKNLQLLYLLLRIYKFYKFCSFFQINMKNKFCFFCLTCSKIAWLIISCFVPIKITSIVIFVFQQKLQNL
jgi:hypothetical protein